MLKPGHPPEVLTLGRFIQLFWPYLTLFSDLLVLMKSEHPTRKNDECLICLNQDRNTVVLSCSHGLCSKCAKRWVSRRLKCPFCRHDFSKKDVTTSQWELLEWQAEDVEKDVARLQGTLTDFWNNLNLSSISAELLSGYVSKGRTICKIEEKGDMILVD